MKPSAAFAAGLWTGALVVAALAALHFQPWNRAAGDRSAQARGAQPLAEQLRKENARLEAEAARLRETVADLKSNLEARIAPTQRRVPFREQRAPDAPTSDDWIERAVANTDVEQLPRLEALALQNNGVALEALALMAEQDAAEALTRVWKSGRLNPANQVRAARYLAATLEVSAQGDEQLRALFASPGIDIRILQAAAEGIANPVFPVTLGQRMPVMPPPHFTPDYAARAQLLENLRPMVADDRLRAFMEQARAELYRRAAESEPAAP
jgi:hypothetical protein